VLNNPLRYTDPSGLLTQAEYWEILNNLWDSGFGGTWSNGGGGISYFSSYEDGFYSGCGYNYYHRSWDNTVPGSREIANVHFAVYNYLYTGNTGTGNSSLYLFNQSGNKAEYLGLKISYESKLPLGVVMNGADISIVFTFSYAKDADGLENGIWNSLNILNSNEISGMLEQSGVYDWKNQLPILNLIYAYRQSRNMHMDFVANELTQKANFDEKGNALPTYFIIGNALSGYVAGDMKNTGNYLWGAAMMILNISYPITVIGANIDAFINNRFIEFDSKDDQYVIRRGYFSLGFYRWFW
jgi:hypothetical protein